MQKVKLTVNADFNSQKYFTKHLASFYNDSFIHRSIVILFWSLRAQLFPEEVCQFFEHVISIVARVTFKSVALVQNSVKVTLSSRWRV